MSRSMALLDARSQGGGGGGAKGVVNVKHGGRKRRGGGGGGIAGRLEKMEKKVQLGREREYNPNKASQRKEINRGKHLQETERAEARKRAREYLETEGDAWQVCPPLLS